MSMDLLIDALRSFVDEYIFSIGKILFLSRKKELLSYEEIVEAVEPGDDVTEVLALTYDLRLLLPIRNKGTFQWNNRILIFQSGELFESPVIITEMVNIALEIGKWDVNKAIEKLFTYKESCRYKSILKCFDHLKKLYIDVSDIRKCCREVGIENVDLTIATLKSVGIISPALGYLPGIKNMSPIYEINPSILTNQL